MPADSDNTKGVQYMLNKKIVNTGNERISVKYILRGAMRRRSKAQEAIRSINEMAGIQHGLYAVK